MEQIHALLKLFGERYIFTDLDQAKFDLEQNRDDMVAAFEAILGLTDAGEHDRFVDVCKSYQ